MTHSKLKPVLIYIEWAKHAELKRFAAKHDISMSQVVREAVECRVEGGTGYTTGFNSGVRKCIESVQVNKVLKMKFPSGKSFSDLVASDFKKLYLAEDTNEKSMAEAGAAESGSIGEGQDNPDLGF